MIENVKIYKGNCLEVMDKLIDDGIKVDAVITDPPYNIAKGNNFHTMGRSGIDFGEWDKNFDLFSYIDKVYKILDKNGIESSLKEINGLGLFDSETVFESEKITEKYRGEIEGLIVS